MERNFMTQARHYLTSQQKQKIGQKILFCLASVVVFATVYALILPAITLSNELLCGQEAHKHTEACWTMAEAKPQPELICEFMRVPGVVVHTHNDYCYDGDGKLICRLPEAEAHTHTAECYQERRTLVCEESQELGHEHTNACYTHVRGDLVCTGEGGHTHSEDCYTETENRTLTCTLPEEPGHSHDETCYEERRHSALICTQAESEDVLDEEGNLVQEGHTHSDSCYQEETESVLVCEESDGGGHTHSEDCYTVETERELTCNLQESENHEHTDSCYDWSEELICHETERTSGHVHTEECYEVEEILVCREEEIIPHTHTTEECFTLKEETDESGEDEYILTCTQPEVLSHVHDSSCVYLPETVVEEDVPALICGMEEHEHTESCYMEVYPEDTVSYYCGLAEHEHAGECYFESSGLLRCTLAVHHHDELCQIPELWQTTPEDVEEVEGVQLDNDFVTTTADGYFQVTFHITGYAPLLSGGGETGVEDAPGGEGLETDETAPDADGPEDGAGMPEDGMEDGGGLAPSPDKPESPSKPVQRPAEKPAAPKPPETQSPEPPAESSEPEVSAPVTDVEEPPVQETVPPPPPPEPEPESPIVIPIAPAEPETPPLSPEEEILNSGLAPTQMSLQRRLRLLLPEDGEDAVVEGEGLADVQITLVEQEAQPLPETETPVSGEDGEPVETEVIPERELSLVATLNGQELDLSQCEITATVSLSEELVSALNSRESAVQTLEDLGDVSEDAETPEDTEESVIETVMMVRTTDGTGEILDEGLAEVSREAAAPVVTVSMRSSDRLRTGVLDKWDEVFPKYNVEYYAYLDRPVEAESVTVSGNIATSVANGAPVLPFIDTSGASLPQNTSKQPTKYFELKSSGSGFQIAFDRSKPTQIYRTIENRVYTSSLEMKTSDLDAVSKNAETTSGQILHYDLVELWVMEPGAEDRSDNSAAWTKYTKDPEKANQPGYVYIADLDDLVYTNLANAPQTPPPDAAEDAADTDADADAGTNAAEPLLVTIKTGTTLRLMYNPKAGSHENSSAFYDYDISDGRAANNIMNTKEQGINHPSNYSDSSEDGEAANNTMNTKEQGINHPSSYSDSSEKTKFAFGNGNTNTGTGLGDLTWNGNYLNKTNASVTGSPPGTGRGCTFGLVEKQNGITATGGVKFAAGVAGPDLFGSGQAAGKTAYKGGMTFSRMGDTYTLSSVSGSGIGASNLETFIHPQCGDRAPYAHIFTNNFWPMDYAASAGTSGHDLKFGDTSRKEQFSGVTSGPLPLSDDGQSHNSYFGMKFSVDFQIPAEYVGPLEYFFYGDDDMWGYLVDSTRSRLVCDIGGIHYSVGEYVNLWDYIDQEEVQASKSGKSYRLVFFYTERGASGSTCWMQYTLPNITNVPVDVEDPSWDKEALRVEKHVEGDVSHLPADQRYEFSITLNGVKDQYLGRIFGADDQPVENSDIEMVNGVPKTFYLQAGQYLKVLELPENSGYVVKEISKLPNCHVSVQITDSKGTRTETDTAEGIGGGVVVYTNAFYFELPETGGPGIPWHTLGGGLLMAAGCLWYRKKPEGEGAVDCE